MGKEDTHGSSLITRQSPKCRGSGPKKTALEPKGSGFAPKMKRRIRPRISGFHTQPLDFRPIHRDSRPDAGRRVHFLLHLPLLTIEEQAGPGLARVVQPAHVHPQERHRDVPGGESLGKQPRLRCRVFGLAKRDRAVGSAEVRENGRSGREIAAETLDSRTHDA